VDFFCPLGCTGNHIFEHYNPLTRQYDIVREQESYIANISIRQYNDAGTYKCRCSGNVHKHCHLKVDVIPDEVKPNFTQAILNKSFNRSCSAKGNPPPMMHAEFDSNGCNYTTTIVDIEGNFTRHLIITIPTVTGHCRDVIITCFACNVRTMIELNITIENDEETENRTRMSPTPVPTHTPENQGNGGTSTIHSSSLTLVLAAIIVAEIRKFCM